MVIGAPIMSFVAIVAVFGLVWATLHFLYRHRIEGLKDELDRERAETARLRARPPDRPVRKRRSEKTEEPTVSNVEWKPRPVASPPPEERLFVSDGITPSSLMMMCDGKTALQAKAATSMYLGKWIRIEGSVADISEHSSGLFVSIKVPITYNSVAATTSIWLHFPGDRERLEIMQAGDTVRAIGQIETVKRLSMDFEFCELDD